MANNDSGVTFRFRRNDSVGTADAESDDKYLSECFVETGDLQVLRDCSNPKRLIVGRTGAGKSALLRKLREVERNVIELSPQNLCLSYIANSDVINFFESAGVNLDLFYQLLWKHVLAVELLKHKFKLNNEDQKQSFFAALFSSAKKDRSKEAAIEYLRQWGETFWNETEYRVKELTTKVETDLHTSIEGELPGVKIDAGGGKKLTEEQKQEVIQRGKKVVNDIQIKALADVIRLLSEDVFDDPQNAYFITIDGIDEIWVDEALRYKLIRALIETVRSFQKIRSVKIIVAIRSDLLHRVIEATRDAGFQEEKYASLYLKLKWSRSQIEDLLDQRIGKLVREQYRTRPVKLKELFPRDIGKIVFLDYLLDRTFYRPRDAILFVNGCLEQAENRNSVTATMVSEAEGEYSSKRLNALQEEWGVTYPNLTCYAKLLQQMPVKFKLSAVAETALHDLFYSDFCEDMESTDPVFKAAREHILNGKGTLHGLLLVIFEIFYIVGLVGIKPDTTSSTFWSFHNNEGPASGAIKPTSVVHIHPTFWRTLGSKMVT